ncbi:unnamed protein product, partial [Chrysoparadoxa australica]
MAASSSSPNEFEEHLNTGNGVSVTKWSAGGEADNNRHVRLEGSELVMEPKTRNPRVKTSSVVRAFKSALLLPEEAVVLVAVKKKRWRNTQGIICWRFTPSDPCTVEEALTLFADWLKEGTPPEIKGLPINTVWEGIAGVGKSTLKDANTKWGLTSKIVENFGKELPFGLGCAVSGLTLAVNIYNHVQGAKAELFDLMSWWEDVKQYLEESARKEDLEKLENIILGLAEAFFIA